MAPPFIANVTWSLIEETPTKETHMYFPHLEYAKNIHQQPIFDIEDTLIVNVLKNSYGQATMSDDDVKMAVVSLFNTCKTQQSLIDELIECVNKLRTPKKSGWKFWIRLT